MVGGVERIQAFLSLRVNAAVGNYVENLFNDGYDALLNRGLGVDLALGEVKMLTL